MKSIVAEKSLLFAIKAVNLCRDLIENKKEFILSKQLMKSATAIGAMIREAEHGQSKADFIHKMNISLKEANETVYWLILLEKTDYISASQYATLHPDAEELLRLLVSIVKTSKTRL